MRVRRVRAGLRGWGGVGAMAVVCALTAVFALLLPLSQTHGGGAGTGAGGLGHAVPSRAEACEDPEEQSPPPSGADGPTIEAIKNRKDRRLVIGVDQNSYRWGYRDPNSDRDDAELEGFDIDLAHRIAQEILGDPDAVRFRAVPTNERIPAIKEGRVDMVVRTMSISCERLREVAFSAPYFETGQQLLAPRKSDIEDYDEKMLEGKRICAAQDSTALATLEADREAGELAASTEIRTVPNQLDCLVRLQLGEVDAVVTDSALAASQAAQDPSVALKGKPFTTEYYGVAMKKGPDDDLVRRVNQVLEDYRRDGWEQSYDKWLAGTLGESPGPPSVSYR
ncbi:glutamate ABC transporter substrate-binding protein [Streptomyces minutiscleroticus]|uniref:Sugar-binding protein n=1 Tax=Streptomyces minutiscleroticus TaxID=68238 RepID=A0A918N9F4_9ACTN|nr:glutamate ABC transporter substrate-binding protein [Streptomyces minutiscleroticus]GGX50575.1 sugar-binding protein [Streptomyces minutiscleroticus]